MQLVKLEEAFKMEPNSSLFKYQLRKKNTIIKIVIDKIKQTKLNSNNPEN